MQRAVLWDNDGVLVDTEGLYYDANRRAFAEAGRALPREAFVRLSLQEGRSVLTLLEDRLGEEEIERLRERRNVLYSEILREGVPVLPGVRETLAALRGRAAMAIVTSCRRDHFELMHEGTGLLPHFDFVLAGGDYRRHKPHPEPYERAVARLGLPREACVVVEDSERGVAAAHAAGLRCLAVPHAWTRGGRFDPAERVLRDAHELRAWLEAWLAGGEGERGRGRG